MNKKDPTDHILEFAKGTLPTGSFARPESYRGGFGIALKESLRIENYEAFIGNGNP